MKNFRYAILLLLFALLTACSSSEQTTDSKTQDKAKEEEKGVEVDKGLLNVELTLPASMFEGEDIDTVIANAKEDGIGEVTKNEDGSLTYKMSKSKHKELMQELEAGISETLEETKNSGDFVSIKDITHNKSFSEFTLVVDKAAFENSMDGFAAFGLGMSGMYYQLYGGEKADDVKVTIFMKDQATEEVVDEIVYPDDMQE